MFASLRLVVYLSFLAITQADFVDPLCHHHEKLALLHFKQSFFINCSYAHNPRTAYPKQKSWKLDGVDCCMWDGVKCDKRNGHVIGLDLSNSCIYGNFPSYSTVFELDHLLELNLAGNNFNFSRIPQAIGRLSKLTILDLSHSLLNGQVPSERSQISNPKHEELDSWLPKLQKLTKLFLSDINLGGEMPEAVKNHTALTMLDLSHNQLSGPLPNWLGNLTKLTGLYLQGNYFQGPVPQSLSQLINLEGLYIHFNNSAGTFDTFLKLKNLRNLALLGVSLTFSPIASTNTSAPKFNLLVLHSCNLTEFPQFLHAQDELVYLLLRQNNIRGNIPQWFVNLTRNSLSLLDLSNNSLTGFEDPTIFVPWMHLKYLNLGGNKIQGLLPSPPSSLEVYLVSHNLFDGVIPKQICDARKLIFLDLSENNMSGQIPHCVGYLDSLVVLNLLGNEFSGNIPQTFSQSCQLKMINISKNRMEGQLPKSLINCTMLEVLDMGKNHINGTFPAWLGSLPKLKVLVLSYNSLHGNMELPKNNAFRGLCIIDISHNFIEGHLPSSYMKTWTEMAISKDDQPPRSSNLKSMVSIHVSDSGASFTIPENIDYSITIINKGRETYYSKILTVFRVIDFSSNNFTGAIPDVIGKLKGLQVLNLSNNNLEGHIPPSLAKPMHLESLDLSHNKLSGEIPRQLTQLPFLSIFNVSQNHLVGPVPQGEQFNTFDNSSYDGNFGLCGVPLSNKCDNVDTLQSPPVQTTDDTEEDSELIDWVVRVCGFVSGLTVGFILGKMFIIDKYNDWFIETFARNKRP